MTTYKAIRNPNNGCVYAGAIEDAGTITIIAGPLRKDAAIALAEQFGYATYADTPMIDLPERWIDDRIEQARNRAPKL